MKRSLISASFFVLSSILTACGGDRVLISSSNSNASTQTVSSTSGSASNSSSSSTSITSSSSGVISSVGTNTTSGTQAPISLRVGAVGYNSTSVQVQTGTVLKVKFTPGIQDQAISGGNVYPQYSHLGVYLTVNGTTVPTEMLSNGLNSAAQTGSVIDFSNIISQGCAAGSNCRQTVTITVDHPNNDYWCLNYGQFCPWTQVYSTHPWHGTLTIQTDDTVGI